ncbi:kinesin-like protein KIN-12E [Malania oleifera]|uniref:kinesin-like protein KIN-12E n=1 Tax=Malania oleifera TaxID=397392 RepID=UPI0025AE09A0|nr:kinesin-like protein KIN-12E [Malania oleifera]
MPFISEAASAIKSRFGFHDSSSEALPIVPSSPFLLKSASKDNFFNSSAIRNASDRDDRTAASSQSFELPEDSSFWKDHNVQVIIRIRPLSSFEISLQGYNKCVRQESCQTITWTGHPESRFTFDVVADEYVSQEKLFKVAGLPMVDNCMEGYNSCMFAYGQTGSGKTHTMLGDIEGGTRRHSVDCGMTPRVFEFLFSRIQKEKETRRDEKLRFTCKCSFLEIYNEQILDLLDPSSTNLQIREDTKKGVYVENLKEMEVASARDVIQQLVQGAANRKVAATNMNRASSRSHSVFTCTIESKWEAQGVAHHRFARLNLVDLAGSERQKSSGAEGDRLKEATNINKSLSTLGLVIMNLVNMSNGKSLHVPYRDSKLTFLLQDSLGGNSKTTIIANISPSNCCSLETLSTLKFAQRAKFIKNNAIVNEDASGDVLAMRIQIQQLKKEVSRLRGLVNGGADNQENDTLTASFPGSPGCFKWEGLQGSFSPLATDKRMSHKKDYEVALVGAFRREKDKDIAFQALAAENQAAMQLAKQREDEIQGLKMRLRLREAGIKRLEAVASGKISAETHLLKEREEHLKEIEVLRTQVDRNQEATRFAMENLRLKEEIRRLKSFCEEGERDMLNEQITVLENKLLEALDWKLMHETGPSIVQKGNSDMSADVQDDANLLTFTQPASPWHSTINEENEFLRMQAIQNQAEMDTLHKKLNLCLEEKEKLERHVNELVTELEKERSSRDVKEETKKLQIELPSLAGDVANIAFNDQIELKTMVDAIAAASQREAEAHETAIILSKENDELRMKLKVLIEDNNKLIELYEQAVAETNNRNSSKDENVQKENNEDGCNNGFAEAEKASEANNEDNSRGDGGFTEADNAQVDNNEDNGNGGFTETAEENEEIEMRKVIENLEHQLMEMHEENEKLMGLYENAMQERDEFKRMFVSGGRNSIDLKGDFICPEKLVEVDEGECVNSDEPRIYSGTEILMGETSFPRLTVQDVSSEHPGTHQENERLQSDETASIDGNNSVKEMKPSEVDVRLTQDINLVRMKLDGAQQKLSDSVKAANVFCSLEKAIGEVNKLSREIETMEDAIRVKQEKFTSLKLLSSERHEKRLLVNKKLLALKYSLLSSSSSVVYFEQREVQARARLDAAESYLNKKKEELACLQAHKNDIEAAQRKIQQSEVELRNHFACLKSKLEEENRRRENEKVLLVIDNVEKTENVSSQRNWQFSGKATELLKSEEEKIKLQTEMSKSREKLEIIRREVEDVNNKYEKVESRIHVVEMEIQKGLKTVEQMELGFQGVIGEKSMLLEFRENGKAEFDNMILEFQQAVFEVDLRDAEIIILEGELQAESKTIEEIQRTRSVINEKMSQLLKDEWCHSHLLSERMEEALQDIIMLIVEAKSLLANYSPNDTNSSVQLS